MEPPKYYIRHTIITMIGHLMAIVFVAVFPDSNHHNYNGPSHHYHPLFCGLLCKVNSIITRWSMEEEDNHIDDQAGRKEYLCPIPNCLAIVQLCLLFPFVIVVSGGNNSPTE